MLLNEQLADWSAVYLAMWKALESFDLNADRWSEPVSFGNRDERLKAAENAISRVRQRYGNPFDEERERDVQAFREHVRRLSTGAPFGAEEARFTQRIRQIGSSLADQSVVAANTAESQP